MKLRDLRPLRVSRPVSCTPAVTTPAGGTRDPRPSGAARCAAAARRRPAASPRARPPRRPARGERGSGRARRRPPAAVLERPAARRVRDVNSAGSRPNTIAVTTVSSDGKEQHAPVDRRRRRFAESSIGVIADDARASPPRPAPRRESPHAPPAAGSRSGIAGRGGWRVAPIADRTATSRARDAARASSRLATLMQAMSSSSPTAASSTNSAGRKNPTTSSMERDHARAPSAIGAA